MRYSAALVNARKEYCMCQVNVGKNISALKTDKIDKIVRHP